MAGSDPSCHQATADLVALLDTLRKKGVITSPLTDEIVRKNLHWCKSCLKKPNSRKCLGWSGKFRGAAEIEIPATVKKNKVVARISGAFSFKRRTAPKKLDGWQPAPATEATFAIEVRKVIGNELYARHHIDLANPNQPGPVWHLQLGGLTADEHRSKVHEWLDVPRWPILPMDMVLVLELAIYNFRNEEWSELRGRNPWRHIVKRSERLMHSHYRERLTKYFNQQEAGDSWLAFQCNRARDWNPRPV